MGRSLLHINVSLFSFAKKECKQYGHHKSTWSFVLDVIVGKQFIWNLSEIYHKILIRHFSKHQCVTFKPNMIVHLPVIFNVWQVVKYSFLCQCQRVQAAFRNPVLYFIWHLSRHKILPCQGQLTLFYFTKIIIIYPLYGQGAYGSYRCL